LTIVTPPRVFRFTVADYQLVDTTGVFGDARTELEDGVIVEMSPIGEEHARLVDVIQSLLAEAGVSVIGRTASTYLRIQQPVLVDGRRQYQPDFSIVRGPMDRYPGLPGAASTLLVGEVADATLDRDLRQKLPAYRAAGFATIVVVDVASRAVHRAVRGADGSYVDQRLDGDAEWYPGVRVADLFPERS
jgi:Uma2 family endonuclease